jgi:TolB-like protein/Flp pilus assembly protein TadD
MSVEPRTDPRLEIAHVLFIDVVGYSKLLMNEQSEVLQQLNQIVRNTEQFRKAEAAGKLIRIPVGDGMALVFFNNPEAPVRAAVEISEALQNYPRIQLRMGIHSGPVNEELDVNDRSNVAGAGINMAQRVMECGDAGHILLSKRVADDLAPFGHWRSQLHELGECEVKHGESVYLVNFYNDKIGNRQLPQKLRRSRQEAVASAVAEPARAAAERKRIPLVAFVLAGLALTIGVLLFLYGVAPKLRSRSAATTPAPLPEKSIAVLPLENLSDEKENAFFADGIQDELLSNIAKIMDLKVISRTSVLQYKSGIMRNLKEIAQQLGVGNVVEGSVRRSGNHIRVSVQLIDALTDRHIWVHNYDRTLADSLALQGELATEIAAGVGATLSPQEKARVEAKPTNNPAAYDAYLRGRAFAAGSQFDKSTVENAIQSYQEAVRLDPSFVLAWVDLSCVQSGSFWLGEDPSPERLAAAKDSADRALALDPNLPETHLALGYYRYYGQQDFTAGLAEFQQAEKGLPNNVDVIEAIGRIQRRLGHWEEAIVAGRRAIELDPRYISAYNYLALTYTALRRFPEALATVDRALALEPANTDALGLKASVLWRTGDLQAVEPLLANPGTEPLVPGLDWPVRGVQALFQRRYAAAIEILSSAVAAKTKRGEPSSEKLLLGLGQQRAGDVAAARATYQNAVQDFQRWLEKVVPDSYPEATLHAGLGWAYAGLGEAASAIAEGQKAMAIHPTSKDPFVGPEIEENMADIYALLGDADHAIPILKRLLQIPYGGAITPALLRLDPVWDQIRNDPRFQELAAEKKL